MLLLMAMVWPRSAGGSPSTWSFISAISGEITNVSPSSRKAGS